MARKEDEQSSLVTVGSGLAALKDLKLDRSMSLSVGRRAANDLLVSVFPSKTSRDFILLNLQKAQDGR